MHRVCNDIDSTLTTAVDQCSDSENGGGANAIYVFQSTLAWDRLPATTSSASITECDECDESANGGGVIENCKIKYHQCGRAR